jgi:hypothetical protein
MNTLDFCIFCIASAFVGDGSDWMLEFLGGSSGGITPLPHASKIPPSDEKLS